MWKSLSNWWNKEKIALEQQLADANERLDNIQHGLDQALVQNKILAEKTQVLLQENGALWTRCEAEQKDRTAAYKELEDFKELHPNMKAEGVLDPWMIIEVNGENSLKGLKINIDWNEAIVQHMKDKGHGHRDDNVTMQHFIVQLYEHVVMILENRVIEESDLIKPNEFE